MNAYWTADGTTADTSGKGNTLTLVNGATYGPGKYGQAFILNGSNQYLSCPSPSFNLVGADFTISLWANFRTFGSGGVSNLPYIFIGEDQGPGYLPKWFFYYNSSTASLGFHVNNSNKASDFAEVPVSVPPTTNTWNMFTVTGKIASASLSFYYNGQFLGQRTNIPFPPDPHTAITIGEAEGAEYLNGGLDDIRIYNAALTDLQVASVYNNSVAGTLLFTGLVAYAATQNVTFTFRSTDGTADIIQTALVPPSGVFVLSSVPPKDYALHIKADKYLAVNVDANTTGGLPSVVKATLPAGGRQQ